MMKYLVVGALALSLTACAGTGDRCADAQTGLAKAQAAIALYQTKYPDKPVPAELLIALDFAKEALPLFCPAPTVVMVP